MPVQLIHFLFSVANSLSVGVSLVLALVWFVSAGFYIREKLAARQAAVKLESFDSNLVEKTPAHI
jgi:uncharacterized membrane protein YciS (DUF1049 family)